MTEMGSLAAALVAAQAEMPAVAKDSTNPHFRWKFVSLDALIAATRPVLNKHGLAILQLPAKDADGEPMLRTLLIHGPTGERLEDVMPLYLSREDSQGHGSAITYARRYAWAALLGVASEEDLDGNTPGAPAPTARAEPKPKPPKPPPRSATRKATGPQIGLMGEIAKTLDAAGTPIPPAYAGAETWVEVMRMRMRGEYEKEHRNELLASQANELIDWLRAQEIPF